MVQYTYNFPYPYYSYPLMVAVSILNNGYNNMRNNGGTVPNWNNAAQNPYWNYAAQYPYWNYAAQYPYWNYSATPPPNGNYSVPPPPNWNNSALPPPNMNYSALPPPNMNYSALPPPNWNFSALQLPNFNYSALPAFIPIPIAVTTPAGPAAPKRDYGGVNSDVASTANKILKEIRARLDKSSVGELDSSIREDIIQDALAPEECVEKYGIRDGILKHTVHGLRDVVGAVIHDIKSLGGVLEGIPLVPHVIDGIAEAVTYVICGVENAASDVISGFDDGPDILTRVLVDLIELNGSDPLGNLGTGIFNITKLIGKVGNEVTRDIALGLEEGVNGLVDEVESGVEEVFDDIDDLLNGVGNEVTGLVSALGGAVGKIGGGVETGLGNIVGGVKGGLEQILGVL